MQAIPAKPAPVLELASRSRGCRPRGTVIAQDEASSENPRMSRAAALVGLLKK